MSVKDSLKEVSPINLRSIDKKTHVTVELGMLIRGAVLVAMAVMAYMNFMVRVDRLESANRGLQKRLVIADSLMRKDVQAALGALHKDLSTGTAEMVTARETEIREVRTSLITEVSALDAAILANSGMITVELDNLKTLIISANATTHAELKPAIKNIQTAVDIQMEALNQRIALIEGQLQEQVKRSLWGFGKK